MCGIAGAVGGDPGRRADGVRRAVAALAHRGPDGHGLLETPVATLGHSRLAVLDLTAAADQPMVDPASGCALVYNGEIYNYRELRRVLEGAGHRLASTGDTEVLLHAYLEWGPACLPRLNGMFAFALWDPRRQAVLVARDRFGEKPLHLAVEPETVWFASEAKALLAAGAVRPAADAGAVLRYLLTADGGHPTATVFAGITQLAPAHAQWLRPGRGSERAWRWWALPPPLLGPPPAPSPTPDEAVDQLAELFDDAVSLRLRSDVEVGTSLSGGTDSSLVIEAIRRVGGPGTLHAFTASFPGSATDELPAARDLADRLAVTLHPVVLGPADLERDLDAVLAANERPVESASVVAQFAVMRSAAEAGVTVLLDGQGADETWAGYPKYAALALADELATGHLGAAARRRSEWRAAHHRPLTPATSRYLALLGGPASRRRAWSAVRRRWPPWLAAGYREQAADADPLSGIPLPATRRGRVAEDAPALDLTRVLLPRLLHYADRNSMAWSREVRLPYLDHRLVELAAETPLDVRMADGWTKEPLRALLERRGLGQTARRPDKVAYMPPDDWLAAPAVARRTEEAWADLHHRGLLASAQPVPSPLVRWRVLALATWAEQFEVALA
jgi:asparagine synthase (glutamine-hydrolysing)